jgi:Zn-dependent protease
MKRFFRNGAGILFVLSIIVFVGVLSYQLVLVRDLYHSALTGPYQGAVPPVWMEVIAAFAGALSAAAVPFFGACVIDRLDLLASRKEMAE